MTAIGATPGELLYYRWCGSETTNRARYYGLMDPVDRLAWERIGDDVRQQMVEVQRLRAAIAEHRRCKSLRTATENDHELWDALDA